MFVREGVPLGGKELSIEIGRMAKQADGAVVVRYGDSMVLVTAVASADVRPGIDFMPLTVDYLEKTSAAGQDPGRLFQARGPPDRDRGADLAAHRPAVPPAVSQEVALRHAGHRDGALHRPREPDRRAGHDRRLGGAAPVRHSLGRPVRGCARGAHRGRVRRQPDRGPTRDLRARSDRRGQPRRHRDGRGWRAAGGRGGHRRRADVRAQGGAAPHRPAGEAARGGRQAEARVRAPGRRSRPSKRACRSSRKGKIEAAMAIREKLERYAALDRAEAETIEALEDRVPRERGATSRRSSARPRRRTCASWCSTPAAASTAAPPTRSGPSPAR